ncbi:unnamed protein product [Heligmosomoides polygyrus]|uniref:Reverse transcriptase domain-containing protein n=1 Tax=Heligmosomoides polygyrus TaxID=6339 RepID=A0A183GQ95_HELPZ|nr:unnamed protein product [Heligmosomoides polygyrus]
MLPLCLTFIDLKKAFEFVETEAVVEALLTQGVPVLYIRVLRELYNGFTTKRHPRKRHLRTRMGRHGVKDGGRHQHYLTLSASQAKQMLAGFDRVCGNVGLQLNLTKTMFMRNARVSDASS